MKKNESQPGVELLPSPAAIVRASTGIDEAGFNQLVTQKVAEAMAARDAFVFEPFFRSRQVAYEMRRLETVSEQRKFSISFERYGCMICETRESVHAGNGMCNECHARWFYRLTQIIAEGMKGQTARPASGASLVKRRFEPLEPRDGVHRTWYRRSNEMEKLLYRRVAKQLGVVPSHVREVARGRQHSESVSAALKKESDCMAEVISAWQSSHGLVKQKQGGE